MQRLIRGALAGAVLISTAVAAQAVSMPMERPMHRSGCPKKDAAVAILSKDPYCAARHLSGDACEARWKAYWSRASDYNVFLEQCRMMHWPEHKA